MLTDPLAPVDRRRAEADLTAFHAQVVDERNIQERSSKQYDLFAEREGRTPLRKVNRIFGGWAPACEAVGARRPGGNRMGGTHEDAKRSLRRAHKHFGGGEFTMDEYKAFRARDKSVLALWTILNLYGGRWVAALADAKLTPTRLGGYPGHPATIAALQRVARELGSKELSIRDYDRGRRRDEPSGSTISAHFGRWSAALEAAGLSSPSSAPKSAHKSSPAS